MHPLPRYGAEAVPGLPDGPEILRGYHLLHGFNLRHIEADTRFRVESKRAAFGLRIHPVFRAAVLIGTRHLVAGRTGHGNFLRSAAYIGELQSKGLEFLEVERLQLRICNSVAAGKEGGHAGVIADPAHLVLEIAVCQGVALRVIYTAVEIAVGDAAVAFPFPLATPAHDCKDALLVAEIIDV